VILVQQEFAKASINIQQWNLPTWSQAESKAQNQLHTNAITALIFM
jgi:hypothetical protein